MSNLPENSTFDAGVYQLELTDPVIGGPSGISNTPLKNLANRTKYLKDHVDALESSRAPLASPEFTGNPIAPTPAQLDTDTSLATTAFVKASGMTLSKVSGYAVSTVLTTADIGSCVIASSGSPITLTLPALAVTRDGDCIFIRNGGAAATIAPPSGGTVQVGGSNYSSVALPSASWVLATKQSNTWVLNGDATLGYSAQFSSSLSTSGWQKLPSGLIIQWGYVSISNTGTTVFFPISFPTACISVQVTDRSQGKVAYQSVDSLVSTGFIGYNSRASTDNKYWFAIGY